MKFKKTDIIIVREVSPLVYGIYYADKTKVKTKQKFSLVHIDTVIGDYFELLRDMNQSEYIYYNNGVTTHCKLN